MGSLFKYSYYFFIFSDDHNRVLLKETASATGSDYINASYIVSDQTPNFPFSFIHLLPSYNKVMFMHPTLFVGRGERLVICDLREGPQIQIVKRHFSMIVGVGTIPAIPPLLQDYGHKKLHLSQIANLELMSSTRSSTSCYKNLSWCDTPFHALNIAVSSCLWQWMGCFVLLWCVLTLHVTLNRWTMIPRILLTLQHRDP